jgi:hypothetical protein
VLALFLRRDVIVSSNLIFCVGKRSRDADMNAAAIFEDSCMLRTRVASTKPSK